MIHKALRAMLYDTGLTLQQTLFSDAAEAENALQKVEAVLHQFEQHAHHEDTYVLPSIIYYNPWLANEFEKEHITDNQLSKRLQHLLNIFRATTLAEERMIAGSAIAKAFTEFMVFNLEHMAKEEIVLNQAFWQHYTDAELMQLNQTIVANIPEDEKRITAQWMMRGVNKDEAIHWLKGMKQNAPEADFWRVYNLTKTELPMHRRVEVQEAIIEREAIY
jgi:hypothetical protein